VAACYGPSSLGKDHRHPLPLQQDGLFREVSRDGQELEQQLQPHQDKQQGGQGSQRTEEGEETNRKGTPWRCDRQTLGMGLLARPDLGLDRLVELFQSVRGPQMKIEELQELLAFLVGSSAVRTAGQMVIDGFSGGGVLLSGSVEFQVGFHLSTGQRVHGTSPRTG
jgi:hypothetical protein